MQRAALFRTAFFLMKKRRDYSCLLRFIYHNLCLMYKWLISVSSVSYETN